MTAFIRVGLGILTAATLVIGTWTQYFPESFYRDFPTVDLTPPFSEHLMRDFGGATLGLAVALGAALIWPQTRLVIVACVAYLLFAVPHFLFHLEHLSGATPFEAAALVGQLAFSVLVPLLVIVFAVVRMRRDATVRDPAVG